MTVIFTICSNNYLAQAIVLEQSLKTHQPGIKFFTILVDEYSAAVNYNELPFPCIFIKEIEPDIDTLTEKYDIVELNTCIKPAVFQYFFNRHQADKVIYFDPDIRLYDSLDYLEAQFKTSDILLTPHIYTPIPIDGKKPDENHFLNHGTFNLGFIAVKQSEESKAFIDWWKNRTYLNGYNRVAEGVFVDQLYINLVPVFFKGVHIITDWGYNMAPWNIHERRLIDKGDGLYWVNGNTTLKFFHFSSFKIDTNELPVHYYNRYYLAERPDLLKLLTDYKKALLAADYQHYQTIKCVYFERYKIKKAEEAQERWNQKSFVNKMLNSMVKKMPDPILNKLKKIVKEFK